MVKLISWNIAHREDAWRQLSDSDADIALLQEAAEPPTDIAGKFDINPAPWCTAGAGLNRPWRTAIVRLSTRRWSGFKPNQLRMLVLMNWR